MKIAVEQWPVVPKFLRPVETACSPGQSARTPKNGLGISPQRGRGFLRCPRAVLAATIAFMGEHYSHTVWIAKPGYEDEFVRRWSEFEEWSAVEGLSAHAKLLRDVDEPGRFISFGPWETLAAIRR